MVGMGWIDGEHGLDLGQELGGGQELDCGQELDGGHEFEWRA
jgi:hypothetical protein